MKSVLAAMFCLFALGAMRPALAHSTSTSYLQVEVPASAAPVELRWDATHVPGDSTVTGGARPLPMSALLARTTWSGSHELEGVILAVGPGIRRGVRTDRASVLDVAPTALAALGYPTAEDMDGRVLSELFETPPQVATIAVNKLQEIPVIVDGELEARKVMNLSLSCDHRVVDGWDAASFMQALKGYIENPLRLLSA